VCINKIKEMELNEKQSIILTSILNGKNAFITGFAGSGKSHLIKYICEILKNIELTAMTGCAALLINGKTLHSALGIGLAIGTPMDLFKKIKKNGKLTYLLNLEVLIIDEVSMLCDILFDKIAELFMIIHSSDTPFGKLQIILVGDMFQLKPVEGDYCFNSKYWEQCKFEVNILNVNMRVSSDIPFDNLLQKFRWGKVSNMDLIEKMKLKEFSGDLLPTKLFSINKDADSINQYSIGLLLNDGNESQTYKIYYTENKKIESIRYSISNKITECLTLCIGAQVMVTRNINFDCQIVNGTRGIIISLNKNFVTIKLTSGQLYSVGFFHVKEINLDFKYMPLILSWAISIHKSQGATIDLLEIDLGDSVFACGQAYTALSRARNSDSVKIINFNKNSVKVSKSVISFYNKFN